ncbi:MAG: L-rhamnose mutarotase [Chitinophagaceae bacterium]
MRRYCLALDLVDDNNLIAEYEAYHKNVWPEIKKSIVNAGIVQMEIYRFSNRLFMIMDVNEQFDFANKMEADSVDPKVQEWEQLMWKYQQAIPGSKPGEKWALMEKIFSLT